MIDSLEYYHNRDDHGNLRTQEEPQPIDEPFDKLYDPFEHYDDLDEDDEDFDSGRTDEELEEN